MQSKKIIRSAILGVAAVVASAQFARAQALAPGYVIGNGALTPNGETLFIDNARSGGGDAQSDTNGFFFWSAVLPNRWVAGEQISLTGVALPIVVQSANPEATTNNTRDGTMSFQFYDLGADNTWNGAFNATTNPTGDVLIGSRDLTFDNIGGASTYSGIFTAPLTFTAGSGGIAMRIKHSTNARVKIEPVANSLGVTRNTNSAGGALYTGEGTTNQGFRMSLAGFNLGDPANPRWKSTATNDWGTAGNWSNNTVPNSAGLKVILGDVLTSPATINLNGARTIGRLELTSAQGYTIAAGAGGALTLNNSANPAELTVVTGNHSITAPVQLSGATTVTTPTNTSLSLGVVSGAGGITKVGPGSLTLSEPVSYAGATTVSAGRLIVGGGSAGPVSVSNVSLAADTVIDYRNASGGYAASSFTSGNVGTVRIGAGTTNLTPAGGAIVQSTVVVGAGATLNASAFATGYDLGAAQQLRIAGTVTAPALNLYADNSVGIGDDVTRATGTATVNGALVLNGTNAASADGLVFQVIGNGITVGPSDQLQVNGALVKTGANPYRITIIPDVGARLPASTTLITHTGGALNASDFAVVGAQAFPSSRISYAIDASTPGVLKLVEQGTALNLKWTGANSATWDNAVTANFVDASNNPQQFRSLDTVRFDDTSTVRDVVYTGDIFATEIVVDTANTYSFQSSGTGQGLTSHTTLRKRGTGKLILKSTFDFTGDGTATYTGPVFVEQGTLSLGGGIVNGGGVSNTVGVDLAAGTTLEIWRVGGTGTVPNYYFPVSGAGTIVKRGDTAALTGPSSTFAGLIQIEEGILQINNAASFGTSAQGVVANGNGGLRMNIAGAYSVGDSITINSTGTSTVPQLAIGGTGTGTFTGVTTFNVADGFIQTDGGSTLNLAGGLVATGNITNTFNGGLRLGGTTTIAGSFARATATAPLTIDGNVTVTGTFTSSGVVSAVIMSPAPNNLAPRTLEVGGLALGAGSTAGATRLDIANNILKVNYSGTSPLPTLLTYIADGLDDDNANGNPLDVNEIAIYSSLMPIAGQTIGYLDNGTSVSIRKTLFGDATLDGTVNFDDLLKLAANYNTSGKLWYQGDFTGDGTVNFDDLLRLAAAYNTSLPAGVIGGAPEFAMAQALVPEPASLGLLAAFSAALTRRRNHR
jgi:autotransporter-associated beta strand protein